MHQLSNLSFDYPLLDFHDKNYALCSYFFVLQFRLNLSFSFKLKVDALPEYANNGRAIKRTCLKRRRKRRQS